MRLTREICEAVVAGFLLGQNGHAKNVNGNGYVVRSPHQRRRGRPPLIKGRMTGLAMFKPYSSEPAIKTKRKYTKRSEYWKK